MLDSAPVEESCERVNDAEVATEKQWDQQEERGARAWRFGVMEAGHWLEVLGMA